MTGEHIFAQWVDDCFPGASAVLGTSYITSRDGIKKEMAVRPFSQEVNRVCGDCNGGWMSRLEVKVAPILTPLIRDGAWTRIRPQAQRTIAFWATKTAMTLQYLHPRERSIPDSAYSELYGLQGPLPRSHVFLARRISFSEKSGPPLIATASHQEVGHVNYEFDVAQEDIRKELDAGSRIFRVTFALGPAVFVVLGHTFPRAMNFYGTRQFARLARCCWPIQRQWTWPPSDPIESIGGIAKLNEAFSSPPAGELAIEPIKR